MAGCVSAICIARLIHGGVRALEAPSGIARQADYVYMVSIYTIRSASAPSSRPYAEIIAVVLEGEPAADTPLHF